MSDRPALSVAIFTGGDEAFVAPLVERLEREEGIRVVAVFFERRRRSFRARRRRFVRQHGVLALGAKAFRAAAEPLARLFRPRAPGPSARERLEAFCRDRSIAIERVPDFHAEATLVRLRGLAPDLGIVYGTRILKETFFSIPRLGSINIHSRKVPEYRGGGPIGFHEMLRGEREIGVTIHQVARDLDAGAVWARATIPIEERDTPESLSIKARAVGRDLFVEAIRAIARGDAPIPQEGLGTAATFRSPDAAARRAFRRRFVDRYRPARRGGMALFGKKLLAAVYLHCGWVQLRNAWRRRTGRVPGVIVNFHRVADNRGEHWMTIGTAEFDRYLEVLESRYRVVSIEEMRRALERGENREPLVAITFDDGYAECATAAAAALENRGMTAAFYVCTGYLEGVEDLAHDADRGVEGLPKMGAGHLRSLVARGFEVGSHTVTHLDFRRAPVERIEEEIVESKRSIERVTGTPVHGLSVPFGSPAHCRPEAFDAARRAGYRYVLSHFDGATFPGEGTFHLRRVRPSLDRAILLRAAIEGWRGVRGIFAGSPQGIRPESVD